MWDRVSEMREQVHRDGIRKGLEQGLERGLEQGLERGAEGRALVGRLATRKFGAETAEQLSRVLEDIADPERLAEISCWSYTRVPRKTFLGHCAEIRRLFAGEEVVPVLMRTCEPSGEPG